MSLCEHCARATFNGFPHEGSPEWAVGTVYFWCPTFNTHHMHHECDGYVDGKPKLFDKKGREMRNG